LVENTVRQAESTARHSESANLRQDSIYYVNMRSASLRVFRLLLSGVMVIVDLDERRKDGVRSAVKVRGLGGSAPCSDLSPHAIV